MDSKKFISLREAYASIYEKKEDKKEEDCVPKSEKVSTTVPRKSATKSLVKEPASSVSTLNLIETDLSITMM